MFIRYIHNERKGHSSSMVHCSPCAHVGIFILQTKSRVNFYITFILLYYDSLNNPRQLTNPFLCKKNVSVAWGLLINKNEGSVIRFSLDAVMVVT